MTCLNLLTQNLTISRDLAVKRFVGSSLIASTQTPQVRRLTRPGDIR